jgi:hypothetical protein
MQTPPVTTADVVGEKVDLDPDLCCPICINVLSAPRSCCTEGHTFCEACITRALAAKRMCPMCREPAQPKLTKQRASALALANLVIRCPNASAPAGAAAAAGGGSAPAAKRRRITGGGGGRPSGCDWTGPLCKRYEHLARDCRYQKEPLLRLSRAAVAALPAATRALIADIEQGNAAAQCKLGYMHLHGEGGPDEDKAEAVRWYRLAAEQGHAAAQTNLATMYYHGEGGLDEDEAEAVRWYRLAAEQGNAAAQYNLGGLYYHGRGGLAVDKAEAVRWYRRAAVQGDADAQYNLGHMCENGEGGLDRDVRVASYWYRLAKSQGHTGARDAYTNCAMWI